MSLSCGIVGLPNVGKSTLFNALSNSTNAEAANYPFCTIEPNTCNVAIPDHRLYQLADIAKSQNIIHNRIELVDIAGLVKGASSGEGLGNRFLSHIREVDAIFYVLRCFDDTNIVHVEGSVNPILDAEIIKTELALADLESIRQRIPKLEKEVKKNKSAVTQLELAQEILNLLNKGETLINLINNSNKHEIRVLNLLSTKPFFYVCNVSEKDIVSGNHYTAAVNDLAKKENVECITISAQIEAEIASLNNQEEKKMFLEDLGLSSSGLDKVINCSYKLLNLITFFTIGPKEAHAWNTKNGSAAPQAAGVIHSDFERGFICAEVINSQEYIDYKGEQNARKAGKIRIEGRDYIVNDGDVVHFRFNV